MALTRTSMLARLHAQVAAGKPIVGGGAGTGISAKCEEAGGIDLIVIYNSGALPHGRARLPGRHDALRQRQPDRQGNGGRGADNRAAHACPGRGLRHRSLSAPRSFSARAEGDGFAGVQNFPTVGLIDGQFRVGLEETGMGFQVEINCIAAAHQLDLLTTPYAFDPDQGRRLTEVGADIVVAHMGLTTSGARCSHRENPR